MDRPCFVHGSSMVYTRPSVSASAVSRVMGGAPERDKSSKNITDDNTFGPFACTCGFNTFYVLQVFILLFHKSLHPPSLPPPPPLGMTPQMDVGPYAYELDTHYPVNPSSDHFHTDAVMPSSDHYGIETVAPSGDHHCIDII